LAGSVSVSGVALDKDGNCYVTGGFTNVADFDPGPSGTGISIDLDVAGNIYLGVSFDATFRAGIIKLNPQGNSIWANQVAGTSSGEVIDVEVDTQGNLYVTGYFEGSSVGFGKSPNVVFLTNKGSRDIYLAKFDKDGILLFAKGFGSTLSDQGKTLSLDNEGNLWLAGEFKNAVDFDPGDSEVILTSAGGDDIFALKLTPEGNYIHAFSFGGTLNETVNSLCVDDQNRFYVTGQFSAPVDFDPGPAAAVLTPLSSSSSMYIACYNSSGGYVFANYNLTASSSVGAEIAVSGSHLVNGGLMNGPSDFGNGISLPAPTTVSNAFIARYQTNGQVAIALQLGGYANTVSVNQSLRIMRRDAAGNIYLAGTFQGTLDFDPGPDVFTLTSSSNTINDLFFAKYSADGSLIFAKGINSTLSKSVLDLQIDLNGNIYITGGFIGTVDFDPAPEQVANLTGVGTTNQDVYFAKYDASGNYIYAKRFGGSGADAGFYITVDNDGNFWVSGTFSGTVDFDPGAGTVNLTSSGATDIFLAKFDGAGNYLTAFRLGGSGGEAARGLAVDNAGNIFATGFFSGTIDFDPGIGETNLTSAGQNDIFIVKYTKDGSLVFANRIGGSGNEFPSTLALGKNAEIVISGTISATVDFDPGNEVANLANIGTITLFVARYTADGSFVYARSIGGSGANVSSAQLTGIDTAGSVFVVATFTGSVRDGQGTNPTVITNQGNVSNMLLARYNNNGDMINLYRFGGPGAISFVGGVVPDNQGHVYVAGNFTSKVNMDTENGEAIISALNGTEVFFSKYAITSPPGTFITAAPGNWDNPAIWQGGKVPPLGAEVMVLHEIIVNVSVICNSLKIEPSGGIHVAPGKELKVLK
jgi:hypothetical protein